MRRWWSGFAPRRRPVVAASLLLVLCLVAGAVSLVVSAPAGTPVGRGFATRARGGVAPGSPQATPTPYRVTVNGTTVRIAPAPTRPVLGPVVLVPGYGGSRGSLYDLAGKIRAGTRRDVYVMRLPGDGTGDLAVQAKALQRLVAHVLRRGGGPVDVIGYSAGGVVVRLWLADDGGAAEARRIISLGSPLHGTQLAAVGAALVPDACPVACQQLVPGSGLLDRLNATPLPPGVAWLSIWTENDRTVDPPDTARLDGAVNVDAQHVCAHAVISHGALPDDPLVAGLVLDDLGAAPLADPGPADCAHLRAAGRPTGD